MLKGFVSGIALALLVTTGIILVFQNAGAQQDDVIWRYSDSTTSTANTNTSGTTSSTAPATSTSTATSTTTATATPPASAPTAGYVALGDSVAAGLGLPTWSNPTAQDRRCGRSPEAYAFEVGRQLKRHHVLYACSGASSGDLFTRQWISNSNPNIQLNQAYTLGTPAVLSITVGANDIGWRQLVQRCYSGTCGTSTQTALVDGALLLLQRNLTKAMDQIEERSGSTPPRVVITGYYNPVSQQCASILGPRVTAQEINWIGEGVNKLNQNLQDIAAGYSFARFAPVDFSGHDVCSADSWVQGLNDAAPIHPTAQGQQAIARSVVAAANAR